jgi:predicted amidophosphoribosyltransferase
MWFIVWFIQAIIAIVLCIKIGIEKNRNGFLWGVFLGLFGLLILAILPPLENKNIEMKFRMAKLYPERECESCGRLIPAGYPGCPYCGFSGNGSGGTPVDIASVKTIVKSDILTIVCPYCNKKIELHTTYDGFNGIVCDRCKKKITKKNAIYG